MRAFGLVGLLVTIGVIVVIMSKQLDYDKGAIDASKTAKQQVQQIGGRDEQSRPAIESFSVDAESSTGKLNSLVVTEVIKDGAMEKYYGLKKGDAIVEIGEAGSLVKVREISNGDLEMAKAKVVDAFRTQQPIVVNRDGETITLPVGGATGTGNPLDAVGKQLDSVKVPTH